MLILMGFLDTGSPIFFQTRVGKSLKPFRLVKFRTMQLNTESVASHLADGSSITKWGRFLRKSKLDELPQLWNVLKGDMSLVGPRPCLFTQRELIVEREAYNVFSVKPGITGLAQLRHIDMSTPKLLAQTDALMIQMFGIKLYLKLIVYTLLGKGYGDKINY